MQLPSFKKILPHLVAIAAFIVIAVVYCKPALDGQVLQQSDIMHWKGMSKDIQNYQETHDGNAPLWTRSMFSGMPGYQIATNNNNFLSYYANEAFSFFIPKPFRFFILACLGFYFLALVIGASPWLALASALGYAYASYNAIIISVGHDTKMLTIAYLPALIGSLWMIYQGRLWLGAGLTALFSSIFVYHNHYQIVYYFLIVAVFMGVGMLIIAIREKKVGAFLRFSGVALASGMIGVMANAVMLFSTYDYSKATIRGGQASLQMNADSLSATKVKGGLDTAYAFLYGSYGIAETFTLLVPDMYGGGSRPLGEDSRLVEKMQEKGFPQELANQLYSYIPSYWGQQPGHAGPVYLGATFCLLFIFGMFFLKTPHRWWMLAVSVFAIFMAWGKNFGAFNNFMFEYLPLYNKFRAPAMILVIPQLIFPMVSIMALHELVSGSRKTEEVKKALQSTGILMAALFLLLAGLYVGLDYRSGFERDLQEQLSRMNPQDPGMGKEIIEAVIEDRKSMFGADLFRSILFAGIVWLMLFLYNRKTLGKQLLMGVLIPLVLIDLLGVSSRYLNQENYVEPEDFESSFMPTEADLAIKQDTDPNYRVLNLTQSTFNDAITSYHHRSVGGYHAAKLSIYQDLIENQLSKQPMNFPVLNMLNTKYIILQDSSGQVMAKQNPDAMGAAWFVDEIRFVPDERAEMNALNAFDPKRVAFVQEKYRKDVGIATTQDSASMISAVKNDNDLVTYRSASATGGFAVFSEVFYDRGWKAWIDDKEAPIIRCNYVLRGLSIPAGNHEISFRFEPTSHYTGKKVTIFSGVLVVVVLLMGFWFSFFRRKPGGM